MALYKPDKAYQRGKEALEKLNTIEAEDIRHYVSKIIEYSDRRDKTIKEMNQVFKGIKHFTRY